MSEVPSTLYFESIIRSEQRKMTLCEALAARFTYHTKDEWKARIDRGLVTLNGQPAAADASLNTGDKVIYRVENYSEPWVPTEFETLYRDEDFLIVSKPAGIPVHHTGRIFYNTFTGVVRRKFHNEELSPMHRLDRDTGGLMIFAENRDTCKRFEKSLDRILLRKIYVAIVRGEFPDGEVECTEPLREDPASDIRIKMFPKPDGKPCKTLFRKIGTLPALSEKNPFPVSVVSAELFTGRKHQIRAHLSHLGFPIIGDKLYSFDGNFYRKLVNGPLNDSDFETLGAHTQMLFAHAAFIEIPGKPARWFFAPNFPSEMSAVIEKLSPGVWEKFWRERF